MAFLVPVITFVVKMVATSREVGVACFASEGETFATESLGRMTSVEVVLDLIVKRALLLPWYPCNIQKFQPRSSTLEVSPDLLVSAVTVPIGTDAYLDPLLCDCQEVHRRRLPYLLHHDDRDLRAFHGCYRGDLVRQNDPCGFPLIYRDDDPGDRAGQEEVHADHDLLGRRDHEEVRHAASCLYNMHKCVI